MMSKTESAERVGLEHLSDEALAAIVEGAANEHGTDLERWPAMAEVAFGELAKRSDRAEGIIR